MEGTMMGGERADGVPTGAAALRWRLRAPGIVIVPGATDALTARVIEEAGFDAVYATGAGIANASFGMPDLGLTTMTEVVGQVGRIADAVRVPVIADADTGYGGPLNVARTVRELERVGVAAIQLEDQVSPKRCGHFAGKEVIPTGEMLQKIAAARHARRDPDLLLIARTDAAAGADVIFVEAPQTVEELRELPRAIPAPLLVNMVEGGRTPLLDAAELEALGYRLVLFANTALRVAVRAVQDAMRVLQRDGTTGALLERMVAWDERQRLVDLPRYEELDRRFASTGDSPDPVVPARPEPGTR